MCPYIARLPLPHMLDVCNERASPFHLRLHSLEVYYSHLTY
jgi:hypothetical protein